MNNLLCLICFSLTGFIRSEERLSWFSQDPKIKQRIFVPENLSEGKEENRVMPWVFHDNDDYYKMELKCIMRGYNASNNPSDYKDARWSHPGFSDSQVNTREKNETGVEDGVKFAIWTIEITTSAADAGKKGVTCEFQQGDFPLSIDFEIIILQKTSVTSVDGEEDVVYGLGEFLDGKYITKQVEDDIKRQISQQYPMSTSNVTRSDDGLKFHIKVPTNDSEKTNSSDNHTNSNETTITEKPLIINDNSSTNINNGNGDYNITESSNSNITFLCWNGWMDGWIEKTCDNKKDLCPRTRVKAACTQL